MIREMTRDEIPACVDIIRESFMTVADEFGFTEENAPRFVAFAVCSDRLIYQLDVQHRLMFVYEDNGTYTVSGDTIKFDSEDNDDFDGEVDGKEITIEVEDDDGMFGDDLTLVFEIED